MKIKDILKKQGELYKNLSSNKTIQKCNETIKPKPPKLVRYKNYKIWNYECKAINELEKLLGKKVAIDKSYFNNFEMAIEDNQVTYLKIKGEDLICIPKQINNLQNLKELDLNNNQISKLENLDNLPNLQELYLWDNKISKIENLDNLTNLKELDLNNNQIQKIENLDNLPNLQELWLHSNQIQKIENLDNLPNLQELSLRNNQISKLENLDNLPNLQKLYLYDNPIKNKEEVEKLRKKGIKVHICI